MEHSSPEVNRYVRRWREWNDLAARLEMERLLRLEKRERLSRQVPQMGIHAFEQLPFYLELMPPGRLKAVEGAEFIFQN